MAYRDRDTLFVFFDESGNFDFSPNGTRYWSLGALCTFHPAEGREAFLDLSYALADEGLGQECFHATEDKQAVRNRVFELIMKLPRNFKIHFATAEKRKVPPSLRSNDVEFYSYMCRRTLRYLIGLDEYQPAKKLVVVFSSIFNKTKHEKLAGEIKAEIKRITKIPFALYFRGTKYDTNCQIADYCCWAISIKWTRQDSRSHDLVRQTIGSEVSFFAADGTSYY